MKWYKFSHLPCSHWVWFHKTFLSTPKKQTPKTIISTTNNKINIVSSKNAITAQVIHLVYNKTKREKSPGGSRYAMLFVTKWKKKKFAETKLSVHMKMLRANFLSCCGSNCVNQYFQILNLVDYGRKVPEGKVETIGLKDHLFHLLKTLTRNIIIWTHCQILVRAQRHFLWQKWRQKWRIYLKIYLLVSLEQCRRTVLVIVTVVTISL